MVRLIYRVDKCGSYPLMPRYGDGFNTNHQQGHSYKPRVFVNPNPIYVAINARSYNINYETLNPRPNYAPAPRR